MTRVFWAKGESVRKARGRVAASARTIAAVRPRGVACNSVVVQSPLEGRAAPSAMTNSQHFDTGLRPEDIDPERPRPLDTPWGSFALYVVDSAVVAAESFCPHMLGPLFQGTLSGNEISCPWHRWRYSLVTGECTWCPEDQSSPPITFCSIRLGPEGTLLLGPPGGAPREFPLAAK